MTAARIAELERWLNDPDTCHHPAARERALDLLAEVRRLRELLESGDLVRIDPVRIKAEIYRFDPVSGRTFRCPTASESVDGRMVEFGDPWEGPKLADLE